MYSFLWQINTTPLGIQRVGRHTIRKEGAWIVHRQSDHSCSKKKRQRQIIKHGDEKEHILITKYMYRSSFKQIFPLQQSCDWTILPVVLRTKTFRKRWGSSALIEKLIEASNQNEKIRQTLDKLTYVSLKNTTYIESFGPLIVVVGGRTVFTSKIYRSKRIQMRAFIIAEANFAVCKFNATPYLNPTITRKTPIVRLF